MRIIVLVVAGVQVLCAQTSADFRLAVTRALPLLERSAASFVAQRACVSCHHNTLTVLAFRRAAERGIPIDAATLKAVEEKTFRQLDGPRALDDAVEAATLSDPTPDDSFLLMAAHAAGRPRDLVTAVYARRLLSWQRDGHWITSDFRPPHSSSVFTASASAVRAIRLYLPEELTKCARRCGDGAGAPMALWYPTGVDRGCVLPSSGPGVGRNAKGGNRTSPARPDGIAAS